MSKIEIEILDTMDNVTGTLDIKASKDFPLSLSYLIADIKNLSIRSGSYSKTFNIPATKENNKLLKHISNPNTYVDGVSTYVGNSYKVLQRKPCVVKVDKSPVLRGEIKLKNVITKPTGKEYVLQLIGDNSDWVKQLQTLYLNELTAFDTATSNTDHTYNKATIEASWSGSYSDLSTASSYAFFYPLINYGTWKNVSGAVVEDMKPAIYIRAIIDAAFEQIGYSISSTFLDSADFKKLVFPFIGEAFTFASSFITSRQFRASVNATQNIDHTITTFGAVTNKYDYILPFDDDSANLNSDAGNLYNTSAYKYVANANHKSNFKGRVTIQSLAQGGNYDVFLRRTRGSSITNIKIKQFSTTPNTTKGYYYESGVIEIESGDEIQIYLQTFFPYTGQTSSGYQYVHKYNVLGFSSVDRTFLYNEIDTNIAEGNSITLKDILPDNISVLDILKGLTHLFNLYYRTDTGMKKVYIEPRDTFFDDITTANDWTNKLQKDSYDIRFIDDYKRKLEFAYKTDGNDGHVKARNEEYDTQLGQYKHTLNDRFMIGEQKYENPTFAATYHIMDRNLIYATSPLNEAKHKAPLIARMWRNWNADDAGQNKFFSFLPRILVKSFATQADDESNNRTWDWEGTSQTNIPTALMSGYGDVTQDNLSFNSTTGLFQTYYGKYINTIEKGVIVTAFFDLKTQDVSEINLKKPIYISKPSDLNGYYVINRILDYAPHEKSLTKVELVKIENHGTATNDSGQTGANRGNLDFGEIGGIKGIDNRKNPFHGGSGGKFADDDPEIGSRPSGATAVLDNGTNFAKKGSNNTIFGEGNIAKGENQTIIGKYAAVDTESVFQVGMGRDPDNRVTALKIDKNGALQEYGGQIQVIIDGVVNDVLMEDEDNEKYLKVFKSE